MERQVRNGGAWLEIEGQCHWDRSWVQSAIEKHRERQRTLSEIEEYLEKNGSKRLLLRTAQGRVHSGHIPGDDPLLRTGANNNNLTLELATPPYSWAQGRCLTHPTLATTLYIPHQQSHSGLLFKNFVFFLSSCNFANNTLWRGGIHINCLPNHCLLLH